MTLLVDGRLSPCNADAEWRDEGEMLSRWTGLPDGPAKCRALGQWFRLAHRDRGWRQYMGVTRSPRCLGHAPGRNGWG